jgi:hypothetical protein
VETLFTNLIACPVTSLSFTIPVTIDIVIKIVTEEAYDCDRHHSRSTSAFVYLIFAVNQRIIGSNWLVFVSELD